MDCTPSYWHPVRYPSNPSSIHSFYHALNHPIIRLTGHLFNIRSFHRFVQIAFCRISRFLLPCTGSTRNMPYISSACNMPCINSACNMPCTSCAFNMPYINSTICCNIFATKGLCKFARIYIRMYIMKLKNYISLDAAITHNITMPF